MAATILLAGCDKKSPGSSTTPPPAPANAASSSPVGQPPERAIVAKAKNIVLPEFKLDGVGLPEALRLLQAASKQNDPQGQGVNFMIMNPEGIDALPKITLALKNVTLSEATERVAKSAGVGVSAQDYAFIFDPKTKKP